MSKKCIKCGAELDDKALFCDECGMKQAVEEMGDALSEQEKLAADLEHTNSVAGSISSNKLLISLDYDKLEELERKASGVDGKVTAITLVLLVLGIFVVIFCFRKFGMVVGIISIYVVYRIVEALAGVAEKNSIEKNKDEYEANQKEYQEKKDELEQRMKKNQEEIEELELDVTYQRYSYLLRGSGSLRLIPSAMIKALREGKAQTIEEAEKFADY